MKYYVMDGDISTNDAVISNEVDLDEEYDLWIAGARFNVKVKEPVTVEIWEEDEGYMIPLFEGAVVLMREDMVKALLEVGVDNLDIYKAKIIETRTGIVHSNYKAVNIIGVVKAVDLDKSKGVDFGIEKTNLTTMIFDDLKLDKSLITDLKFFRLAESASKIIVNETVKKYLRDKGIEKLYFQEV